MIKFLITSLINTVKITINQFLRDFSQKIPKNKHRLLIGIIVKQTQSLNKTLILLLNPIKNLLSQRRLLKAFLKILYQNLVLLFKGIILLFELNKRICINSNIYHGRNKGIYQLIIIIMLLIHLYFIVFEKIFFFLVQVFLDQILFF